MSYQLPEPDPLVLPTGWVRFTADQVLAAYLAAVEDATKVCRTIRHQGYVPPEDGSAATYYNDAAEECEAGIRALAADGLVERKG